MSHKTTINIQQLAKSMSKYCTHDTVKELTQIIFPDSEIYRHQLLLACAEETTHAYVKYQTEGQEYQQENEIEQDLKNFSSLHGVNL